MWNLGPLGYLLEKNERVLGVRRIKGEKKVKAWGVFRKRASCQGEGGVQDENKFPKADAPEKEKNPSTKILESTEGKKKRSEKERSQLSKRATAVPPSCRKKRSHPEKGFPP